MCSSLPKHHTCAVLSLVIYWKRRISRSHSFRYFTSLLLLAFPISLLSVCAMQFHSEISCPRSEVRQSPACNRVLYFLLRKSLHKCLFYPLRFHHVRNPNGCTYYTSSQLLFIYGVGTNNFRTQYVISK